MTSGCVSAGKAGEMSKRTSSRYCCYLPFVLRASGFMVHNSRHSATTAGRQLNIAKPLRCPRMLKNLLESNVCRRCVRYQTSVAEKRSEVEIVAEMIVTQFCSL